MIRIEAVWLALGASDLRGGIKPASTGRDQHRKYLPYAFTKHGANMVATILSSPPAIKVSVYVARAFVRMREFAITHGDPAKRLAELEDKAKALAMSHDTFSRNKRTSVARGKAQG